MASRRAARGLSFRWTDIVQALRSALRQLESYAAGAEESLVRR